MSILDDAIREHLELKRAHGADDAELKRLEDEAFGPPARPDEPRSVCRGADRVPGRARGRRPGEQADEEPGGAALPNIADLQEAPEPRQTPPEPAPGRGAGASATTVPPRRSTRRWSTRRSPTDPEADRPTEERHAIAEQPTEIFDVEGQFEDAATEAARPPTRSWSTPSWPSRALAPVDPLDGIEALRRRGRGRPRRGAGGPPTNSTSSSASSDSPTSSTRRSRRRSPTSPARRPPRKPPPSSSISTRRRPRPTRRPHDERPRTASRRREHRQHRRSSRAPSRGGRPSRRRPPLRPPASSHEDVLEDTPEFLEDAPEDDDLWFEQKPPKDFDFDD